MTPYAWSSAWTRALPARHSHFGVRDIVQHAVILHRIWTTGEPFRWGSQAEAAV